MASVILQPSTVYEMYNSTSVGASFNSNAFPGAELYGTFGIQVIVANQSSVNFAAIVSASKSLCR